LSRVGQIRGGRVLHIPVINDIDPALFENAENFGETTKERNDSIFPMDMPYIAEMQKKYKRLMTDINK
jgi:hypothetical protein